MENFSYSKISTFLKCPKAYKYSYIDKVEEDFDSIERFMGHAVHETLEWVLANGYATLMHLDECLDFYKNQWKNNYSSFVKVIKRDKTSEDYYALGEIMLRDYFHILHEREREEVIALENRFEYPLNKNITYTGIIDCISRKQDGTISITDYKTGSMRDVNSNLNQIKSYAMHIFDEYNVRTVELKLDYLQEKKSVVSIYTSREAVSEIIPYLLNNIEIIANASNFYRSKSILCDWCGYNSNCKKDLSDNKDSCDNNTCPRCGSELSERSGRFGTFIGCTSFPRCRYTRDKW